MWLYDPRTNILKEISLTEISEICGTVASNISRLAKRGSKVKQINCYVFKDKPLLIERKKLYAAEVYQGEVWKRYKDTHYDVSNYGRLRRNYKIKTVFVLPYFRRKYMFVKTQINGVTKVLRLRDMIADTFLQPKPGTCLVHKNGDHTNCSVWNIRRQNRSEVAKQTGGKSKSIPVVLIDEETMEILDWWSSARKAALASFMSHQAISDRCKGKVKSRNEGFFMWEKDYEAFMTSESDRVI